MWSNEKEDKMIELLSDLQNMSPEDIDFILSHVLECSVVCIRIKKLKLAQKLMKVCKDIQLVSQTVRLHPADHLYIY